MAVGDLVSRKDMITPASASAMVVSANAAIAGRAACATDAMIPLGLTLRSVLRIGIRALFFSLAYCATFVLYHKPLSSTASRSV
eukprot:90003-Rhodomonas_salina.1